MQGGETQIKEKEKVERRPARRPRRNTAAETTVPRRNRPATAKANVRRGEHGLEEEGEKEGNG